jgi:hypothetical protein
VVGGAKSPSPAAVGRDLSPKRGEVFVGVALELNETLCC